MFGVLALAVDQLFRVASFAPPPTIAQPRVAFRE
jgi:hypothetical protein